MGSEFILGILVELQPYIYALVSIVAAWLVNKIRIYLNVQNDSKAREAIDLALKRAAIIVKDNNKSKEDQIKEMMKYVVSGNSDSIGILKMTMEKLTEQAYAALKETQK